MSLFDAPNEKQLQEEYPPGTPFMLYSVEYEGQRNTAYGMSHCATVSVGAADRTDEPREFRVFGRLAEQTRKVEPRELPALVSIKREGRGYGWHNAGADTSADDAPPY